MLKERKLNEFDDGDNSFYDVDDSFFAAITLFGFIFGVVGTAVCILSLWLELRQW